MTPDLMDKHNETVDLEETEIPEEGNTDIL